MPRPKRWEIAETKDGIATVTLSSWRWFADWISQEMLDYKQYVFRGYASERWKLESTLDRALKRLPKAERAAAPDRHLANFKMAVRGRRGSHPPPLDTEDDWWALGQHHGLATPLLDWTEIPFVALYFAFNEIDTDGADYRAVWAIHENAVEDHNSRMKAKLGTSFGPQSELRLVRPLSDENARLVSQRGLFVRGPYGKGIEEAVAEAFSGHSASSPLLKIRVPNKKRTVCLRTLNRMNINHLSLFPDLPGASEYCNNDLRIKDY